MGRPPDLLEKSRAKKKKTRPSASATAGYNFQVLYSFGATITDGTGPLAGLLQDAGPLAAQARRPRRQVMLTVFKVNSTGQETVLYNFCSITNCTDGAQPAAGLIQDTAGNLYGTTESGGDNDDGTVFKISSNGAYTSLYSFGTILNAYGIPLDGANPGRPLAGAWTAARPP